MKAPFASMSTRVLAGAVAVATLIAAAVPAQATPLAAPRGAPVVEAPIETVGYKPRRHRQSNNAGAALAAGVAIGVLGLAAAAAAANNRPSYDYYEPYPSYGDDYDYSPGYSYSRPVQYRYYRDDDRYYEPRPRYRQQPPVYYNKEAAKQYWRQQKEIQKRAIKQGYYNQPYYGQPSYRNRQPDYGASAYGNRLNRACTASNPCYPNNPLDQIR
jgi:hypothetical protein